MKYMLMMNTPGGGSYQIFRWPPQDMKAHIAFMMGFARKLRESGELVSAEGLSGPDQAKIVRAGKDGKHRLVIEGYGYRWYRVGGLDYLLIRSDIEAQ